MSIGAVQLAKQLGVPVDVLRTTVARAVSGWSLRHGQHIDSWMAYHIRKYVAIHPELVTLPIPTSKPLPPHADPTCTWCNYRHCHHHGVIDRKRLITCAGCRHIAFCHCECAKCRSGFSCSTHPCRSHTCVCTYCVEATPLTCMCLKHIHARICVCPCTDCRANGGCREHSCTNHQCTHTCIKNVECYCTTCASPDGCRNHSCKWCDTLVPDNISSVVGGTTRWGLPDHVDVGKVALEFYLRQAIIVLDLESDSLRAERIQFEATTASLLSRYLVMVVGGELRHFIDKSTCPDASRGGCVACREVCHTSPHRLGRYAMWDVWYDMVAEGGVTLVQSAADIFHNHAWGRQSAVGGKRWGDIASVAAQYLRGELSDTLFIDSVFGLHHNSGTVFGRKLAWRTAWLNSVLDTTRHLGCQDLISLAQRANTCPNLCAIIVNSPLMSATPLSPSSPPNPLTSAEPTALPPY